MASASFSCSCDCGARGIALVILALGFAVFYVFFVENASYEDTAARQKLFLIILGATAAVVALALLVDSCVRKKRAHCHHRPDGKVEYVYPSAYPNCACGGGFDNVPYGAIKGDHDGGEFT